MVGTLKKTPTNMNRSKKGSKDLTTQPTLENLINIEEQYQVATYKKFPFVIERGEDVWVYTSEGERYLELYGGHAVVSTGHSKSPQPIAASLSLSYWLNRVVEWWMAADAQISRANLLNALSIEFEQINGRSSNCG